MTEDLGAIFQEEAQGYLHSMNNALLQLEMTRGAERQALLTEVNRMAHSLKGAARAMGFQRIETVSHYLEEIFSAILQQDLMIKPSLADTLYDGLDLLQRELRQDSTPEALIAHVLTNLEQVLAQLRLPKPSSSEMPAISSDSSEFPAIPDELPTRASDDLLSIFWLEVGEYLAALNDSLLQVEMSKANERADLLREMNRIAHSMKGAARAVGFGMIETISHYMEEVFQQSINGQLKLTANVADALYDGLDLIERAVHGEPSPDETIAAVLMQLERFVLKDAPPRDAPLMPYASVPPKTETPTVPIPPSLMTSTIEMSATNPTMLMRPPEETLRVSVSKLDQLMADSSELLVARMQGEVRQRLLQQALREQSRWMRDWRRTRSAYLRLLRQIQDRHEAVSDELGTVLEFLERNQDRLAESHRQLNHLAQMLTQDNLQLASLADQLQANVSRLRMMPFESIIGGFQRAARDMARDLGKQIHLEIGGTGVEIDKTVLDALKDPLMHLLRNAIDHGIESPKERQTQGKSTSGFLRLEVEQSGGEIVIRVQDDGRGLNVERIRSKAVERGILSTLEAKVISDDEAQMLIFQSGFSTSEQVTALSGRGLGMDIVRTRVEGLGGRVHLTSHLGKGTNVTLSVPVSLTRLRVISLKLGSEDYAIPSIMVERMATVNASEIFTAEGQEMLTLNERPMPLISLASLLNVEDAAPRSETLQVLAIQTADRALAFEVDYLFNETEIVLKPLGAELANAPFVAGAALLGSGDVLLVLDANDLVRRSTGMGMVVRQRIMARAPEVIKRTRTRVLVVDDSITTRTLEKNILEAEGFEVFVAIDGAEAWSRLSDLDPDLVISDVEMPNMNGLDLTRQIKTHEATKHIPVILLTSLSKPEQREAGLKAGANAYLVKTKFEQRDLLDAIQAVL